MERLIDGVWYDESEITFDWDDQHKQITYTVTDEDIDSIAEDTFRDPNEEEERPVVEVQGFFVDL